MTVKENKDYHKESEWRSEHIVQYDDNDELECKDVNDDMKAIISIKIWRLIRKKDIVVNMQNIIVLSCKNHYYFDVTFSVCIKKINK